MDVSTFLLDRNNSLGQDFPHLGYKNSTDKQSERIQFDVSGQLFSIQRDKLTNGPSSRLTTLYYSKQSQNSIYVDRVPCAFGAILAWYQTGELHIPLSLCPGAFLNELEFWEIKHAQLTTCCFYRLKCFQDEQETLRKFKRAVSNDDDTTSAKVCQRACPKRSNFLSRVWSIVDYREKTFAATAYFMMTVLMVLISIFTPAYMTDPMFQRSLTNCERLKLMQSSHMEDVDIVEPYLRDCTNDVLPFANVTTFDPTNNAEGIRSGGYQRGDRTTGTNTDETLVNDSSLLYVLVKVNQSLGDGDAGTPETMTNKSITETWKVVKLPNINLPVRALVFMETATAVFFMFDFTVRLASCPNLARYFKSIINVSDAVSLVGILVHTFMLQFYSHKRHYDTWVVALEYLQMLRSFRLFRIVKNVKVSRVLVYSVFQNIKDLSVLGLFLVVGTSIFASILYVCEDSTTISSIPVGWYWALVTMTTVGYGDVTPKTAIGRFFACVCATSGVLLFAMTVPIFTNHFIILYQYSAIHHVPETDDHGHGQLDSVESPGQCKAGKPCDCGDCSTPKKDRLSKSVERFV